MSDEAWVPTYEKVAPHSLCCAECKKAREEVARLRDGLRRIRSWDCLNPPRADLLADLPWLARELDALLAEDGAAKKHGPKCKCGHCACEGTEGGAA